MAVRQQRRRFTIEDARWRLLFAGCLMMLLFVIAWARLLYLQTVRAEELRAEAERYGGLRKRRWTVYGSRGLIKDRLGNVLALNVMAVSVYVRPKAVSDVRLLSKRLSPILEMPASEIEGLVLKWDRRIEEARQKGGRVVSSFALCRELVGEKAKQLKAAVAEERQRLAREMRRSGRASKAKPTSWLSGVDVVDEMCRRYPYGAIGSSLIGFTDPDERGLAGAEFLFEKTLRATHGTVEGVLGAGGRIAVGTRVVRTPPQNGEDLQLTIDVNIQSIAEECLQDVMEQYKPAGACAIVMDVRTGDLLAVANLPRIDLNHWEREVAKHGLGVMRNMATTFLFEPGSTFKPFTIAAAMEAGIVSHRSRFTCTGSLKVGERTIRCARHGGSRAHGHQDLQGVVARSCNIATAQIGFKLGARRLYETVQQLGLLDKPFVGAERGRLERPEGWARVRLANVAFGQGVQVTPVNLAAAFAAIANDGMYVKPRLLLNEPVDARPVLSPQIARQMREYLRAVVEEGTGKRAKVNGYDSAGKTGTAQKVIPGRRGYAAGRYVASFAGFAPAASPRIVVLVVVDEPRHGYYGGVVAAPAFAKITERVLAYLGVPAKTPQTGLLSNR
jgi:stage V sporulation protein D (sporulation-specific penicillin-binding protein)